MGNSLTYERMTKFHCLVKNDLFLPRMGVSVYAGPNSSVPTASEAPCVTGYHRTPQDIAQQQHVQRVLAKEGTINNLDTLQIFSELELGQIVIYFEMHPEFLCIPRPT